VIRIRLILTALGLSFVALLVLTPPATADNCDIFINPEDCQNTGWTIGVIATLAGGGDGRDGGRRQGRRRRAAQTHYFTVSGRPLDNQPRSA
jgi:hypothetical protein